MKIEWRKPRESRWTEDFDAYAGKILVASIRRAIGSRGESPKIRARLLLPQTKLSDGQTFEATEFEAVKTRVELAIRWWFAIATADA